MDASINLKQDSDHVGILLYALLQLHESLNPDEKRHATRLVF